MRCLHKGSRKRGAGGGQAGEKGRAGGSGDPLLTALRTGSILDYGSGMDGPVTLPPQPMVEWQLLRLLHQSRSMPIQRAYQELAALLELTTQQKNLVRPGVDRENAFENLCRFARRRLVDQGWMNRGPRGVWGISEKGDEFARVRGATYQSYTISLEELGL